MKFQSVEQHHSLDAILHDRASVDARLYHTFCSGQQGIVLNLSLGQHLCFGQIEQYSAQYGTRYCIYQQPMKVLNITCKGHLNFRELYSNYGPCILTTYLWIWHLDLCISGYLRSYEIPICRATSQLRCHFA